MDGYQWGYLHGLEEGLRRGGDERDAEWNARFGQAQRIVHAAAGWPQPTSREERMQRMEQAERRINQRLDEIRSRPGYAQNGQEEEGQPPRSSRPV